jgi:hypothetical protein
MRELAFLSILFPFILPLNVKAKSSKNDSILFCVDFCKGKPTYYFVHGIDTFNYLDTFFMKQGKWQMSRFLGGATDIDLMDKYEYCLSSILNKDDIFPRSKFQPVYSNGGGRLSINRTVSFNQATSLKAYFTNWGYCVISEAISDAYWFKISNDSNYNELSYDSSYYVKALLDCNSLEGLRFAVGNFSDNYKTGRWDEYYVQCNQSYIVKTDFFSDQVLDSSFSYRYVTKADSCCFSKSYLISKYSYERLSRKVHLIYYKNDNTISAVEVFKIPKREKKPLYIGYTESIYRYIVKRKLYP